MAGLENRMGIRGMALALVFAATLAGAAPASATQLLTNGSFASGLAGWTTYVTTNGTIGTPAAVSFDVTGDTLADPAVRLQVGKLLVSGPTAGGGIKQSFTLASAAKVGFSVDFAAAAPIRNNSSGGVFAVLLDGNLLDQADTGAILAGQTIRGGLGFTTVLGAGSHTLALQALRPFTYTVSTPLQYFAAASLSPVPEPATWTLWLGGFGLVGTTLRTRRREFGSAIA